MTEQPWWNRFLQHLKALDKIGGHSSDFTAAKAYTVKLFQLLNENPNNIAAMTPADKKSSVAKAALYCKLLQDLENQAGNTAKKTFYATAARTVKEGIVQITRIKSRVNPGLAGNGKLDQSLFKAFQNGSVLSQLKKQYIGQMEKQHEGQKNKGLRSSDADEADRLKGFLSVTEKWLKHQHALEYETKILQNNLNQKIYPLDKAPLPLQFRMEPGITSLTYRLVKANPRKPYPEDISILDVINDCYHIPVHQKNGQDLIDDPDVIRFLRLHSEENALTRFKSDPLSQLGSQMYKILVNSIGDIKRRVKLLVNLINRTPLQDLEPAFTDMNPEECRSLLRKKFQSFLPAINEKHYREAKNQKDWEQSNRTIETMEDFRREFNSLKEQILGNPKSTMATAYWLRRMLATVLRNNFDLEKKHEPKGERTNGSARKVIVKGRVIDFKTQLIVGTSITIGEKDISIFYIDPEDILSSEMSIQRADKADKWLAVRKSEKTQRIFKKDFFSIIKNFVEKDLNSALSGFGFKTLQLQEQLLPEIHERLADEKRIEIIRSAILGTVITNLEEFRENLEFHQTLRRYFKKPIYDNTNYPDNEKLFQIGRELMNSSISILQMKYRKVLKVREEIDVRLKELTDVVENQTISRKQSEDFQGEIQQTKALLAVIRKVQQIMCYAKPTLNEVSLEPAQDYVTIKASQSESIFTNN